MTPPGKRLVDGYDLVIFDLDGVVYVGHEPIGGAVEALNALTRHGQPIAYATNNASRRAVDVADLLISLGVAARASEVVTSAQAAARLLADRLPAGAEVLVVGAPALRAEIAEVGLAPVVSADTQPVAVAQGYAPDVSWSHLAEACVAVRGGAMWVATNADSTLPSPRGPLPGNGALVAALVTALGRTPDVIVGKPAPELFAIAARRAGARRALVVGDRLDTDIEGATRAGMDSLLVLTGVTGAVDLLAAPEGRRPTYVAADLRALDGGTAARVPTLEARDGRCAHGGWRVTRADAGLELARASDHGGGGDADADDVRALAALAAMAWARGPVERIIAADAAAGAVLRRLTLVT